MVIHRDGISIELTSEEVHAIHRSYELESLTEDAESQFMDWINYEDMDHKSQLRKNFITTYGFSPEEAMNRDSDHYLLTKLVRLYEHDRNCNVAENDTWKSAISECMTELMERHATTIK